MYVSLQKLVQNVCYERVCLVFKNFVPSLSLNSLFHELYLGK